MPINLGAHLVTETAAVRLDSIGATVRVGGGPGLGPHVKPFVLGRHGVDLSLSKN